MSSGQPRPHNEMLALAIEVVKLIAPYTTRIAIAGSLRRGKPMVGDIEIVCEPAEQPLPTGGRTGFLQLKQNAVNWICDRLRSEKVFEPRPNSYGNPQSWGGQQKWFRYKGVNVDLYAVLPGFSWGRELLIRTGPGDANQCLVMRSGQYTQDGIRGVCPAPFVFSARELYLGDQHIPTPEEWILFHALKLPYIPPPLRSVEMYQRWADRRSIRELPDVFMKNFGEYGRSAVDVRQFNGDDLWLPVSSGGVDLKPRFLNIEKFRGQEKIAS